MSSKSRTGEISSLLGTFLNDNEDDLSPNMFQLLEGLVDKIELIEDDYTHEISGLSDDKEDLEKQLSELEELK